MYVLDVEQQSKREDPKGTGYTPKSALNKMLESEGPLYCQRCFRLRNYNELQPASLTDDDS